LQAELEPLLRVASRLQAAGTLRANPAFRDVSPLRLRRLLAPGPANAGRARTGGLPRPHLRRWATAAALALVAWLIVGTATILASTPALPGEPLYPVKRAAEAVQLAVTWSPRGDARLHLAFAERRIEEMDASIEQERASALARAAAGYRESLGAVQDLLGRLDRQEDAWFVEAVLVAADADAARLSVLAEAAPQEARPAIVQAQAASHAVWTRARQVLESGTHGPQGAATPPATLSPSERPGPTNTAVPHPTRTPSPTPRAGIAPASPASRTPTPPAGETPTRPRPSPTASLTPPPATRPVPTEVPDAEARTPSPTPALAPASTPQPSPDPADRATPQTSPTLAPSRPVTTTVSSEADGVPAVTR
jgi:hypothetical protein